MIGLGCMRLSTSVTRDDDRAIDVIHAALDAGACLLDTARAYCHADAEAGHNERLIARALATWKGDRSHVTVATKGGMRRPNGAWVPDGRAKHLRADCEASRTALEVDVIDLYQLHVVDPKTSLETSVRALARLLDEGKVRNIGLCNVTVSQIRSAQEIAPISSVQVSLSPLDDENLRNGVAEYCQDHGLRLIAYRPLGGDRVKRLAKDVVLAEIARQHEMTCEDVALAWLMSFGEHVVPIPGATRMETASALARPLALRLDEGDRAALDARFSGKLLRVPRRDRRPHDDANREVVIVMGMPGAGKTTLAKELETAGHVRLNRDALGGSLADLVTRLDAVLASGTSRVVLDNTYPTRKARNEVIETAWTHGASVRCISLVTDIADAQINSLHRMIGAHGALPSPETIRALGKSDTRFLLPDAQFRYDRTLEPPTLDDGFTSVDVREFARTPEEHGDRAVIMDVDELLSCDTPALQPEQIGIADGRLEVLRSYRDAGWLLFAHAWRPQVARGRTTMDEVETCFTAIRHLLGDITLACCPHDAGPPVCWCRKPIPGTVIAFAMERRVALSRSIVVGSSAADRTMAERIGASIVASLTDLSRLQ